MSGQWISIHSRGKDEKAKGGDILGPSIQYRIFCDFDGTIALNDVGDQLFIRFGDEAHWWQLVQQWRDKKIDGRQLWQQQSEITRITPHQMDEFAASQPIDPTFLEFVNFCRRHHYPIYILSDGMDAYITRILAAHNINGIEVRANHLHIDDSGRLTVSFPYYEQSCGQCANCKGSHIRRERQSHETAIYIGDGYSDLCAIDATDILFAKDKLARHCLRHHIPFEPYNSFNDVQHRLEHWLTA